MFFFSNYLSCLASTSYILPTKTPLVVKVCCIQI